MDFQYTKLTTKANATSGASQSWHGLIVIGSVPHAVTNYAYVYLPILWWRGAKGRERKTRTNS